MVATERRQFSFVTYNVQRLTAMRPLGYVLGILSASVIALQGTGRMIHESHLQEPYFHQRLPRYDLLHFPEITTDAQVTSTTTGCALALCR